MKKMILGILSFTVLGTSAQAANLIQCKTLGGKSMTMAVDYENKSLEVSVEGQPASVSSVSFASRSGVRFALSNGPSFAQNNGSISQQDSSGNLKELKCTFSSTSKATEF